MRLYGKLIKDTKITKEAWVENEDAALSFRDQLEACLIDLCRTLDIQVPLWLKKNTTEFVRFRRTFFPKEQFTEAVAFDRFEIRMIETVG